MAVSNKDREEYEEGRKDAEKGALGKFIIDISGNHPDSDAYYKGRRRDQLDGDKESE